MKTLKAPGMRTSPAKPAKKEEPLVASNAPPLASPQESKQQTEQSTPQTKDEVLSPPPAAPVQAQAQAPRAGHQQTFSDATPPMQQKSQFRDQNAAVGGAMRPEPARTRAAAAMPELAFRPGRLYSFTRRMPDGSYLGVPENALLHPGDTVRLTINARASGPLVLWEWDTANASWKRIFPPEAETVRVTAYQPYTIPFDIVLKAGERLRAVVASLPLEIPLDVR